MADAPFLLVPLSVISLCLVAMTVTIMRTAGELRRTLHRVNAILPHADQAIRDSHRLLRKFHELLGRADGAMRLIESLIHRVYDTASDGLRSVTKFTGKTQSVLAEWFGNGARAEPRQHQRRR